jgi:hypothetical protein
VFPPLRAAPPLDLRALDRDPARLGL